jgi:hypothetical protein
MQDDLEPPERLSSEKKEPQSWELDSDKRHSLPSNHLGFWPGLGYGLVIIFLSGMLSGAVQSTIPFFLGAAVAIGFVFQKSTRMIFVGYMTIIATICFIFAIVCGPMLRGI